MGKQLRINDPELARQAEDADEVYIGRRLFIPVEFDDTKEDGRLSPKEVARVKEALADPRKPLRGQEAVEYLRQLEKEYDLD